MRIQRVGVCLLWVVLLGAGAAQEAQRIIINGVPRASFRCRAWACGTRRPASGGSAAASCRPTPVTRPAGAGPVSGPEIASKAAMTDGEGRYEFGDLPAGRFTLTTMKSGYVTVQYGQTRPFESGKPIELAEAQLFDKAEIAMPRGSVITGRVLDEFGDPVADADVSALRSVWSNGRRRLQPTGRVAQTNDLGQFRLYGLPPGDYYVSATLRGGDDVREWRCCGHHRRRRAFRIDPALRIRPHVLPGTISPSDAQRIRWPRPGSPGHGVRRLPVRLAKVTGTVLSSEGKPVEGTMVNLVPSIERAPCCWPEGATRPAPTRAATSRSRKVAPGEYTLQTRAMTIMTLG